MDKHTREMWVNAQYWVEMGSIVCFRAQRIHHPYIMTLTYLVSRAGIPIIYIDTLVSQIQALSLTWFSIQDLLLYKVIRSPDLLNILRELPSFILSFFYTSSPLNGSVHFILKAGCTCCTTYQKPKSPP